MSELYLMTSITNRKLLPKCLTLCGGNGVPVNVVALGRGTAPDARSALLMDGPEKGILLSVVTGEVWEKLKREFRARLNIESPGTGIVFTIAMSSIGGRRELAFLTDGQGFQRSGKESVMKGTEHELLIVVSEPGTTEMVMDAAREAGARGGTVIHARGTGHERAEKFLGVTLASEREMTLIVVNTDQRDRIMTAIMMKAGVATPARSIVFSLPVTDVAGLRLADASREDAGPDRTAADQDLSGEKKQ